MVQLHDIFRTESLGSELSRLLPDMRVVVQSPGDHNDPSAGWDSLTVDVDILGGQFLPSRHRSLQSKGFLTNNRSRSVEIYVVIMGLSFNMQIFLKGVFVMSYYPFFN